MILGLLLPNKEPDRDREIFLKLMLMDRDGLLKRKKRFTKAHISRVMELVSETSWSRAIEFRNGEYAWKRGVDRCIREAVEVEAFQRMGLDEKLAPPNTIRPEELPDSALDDIWDEVNAYLGTSANSFPQLIGELGKRRLGERPLVGDAFCGAARFPSRRRVSAATSTPPISIRLPASSPGARSTSLGERRNTVEDRRGAESDRSGCRSRDRPPRHRA